jgi:hypothetical protein
MTIYPGLRVLQWMDERPTLGILTARWHRIDPGIRYDGTPWPSPWPVCDCYQPELALCG